MSGKKKVKSQELKTETGGEYVIQTFSILRFLCSLESLGCFQKVPSDVFNEDWIIGL